MSTRSRLPILFLLPFLALSALSACGDDDDGDDQGGPAQTTVTTAGPAEAAAPNPECTLVPLELVNEKLALTGTTGPITVQKAGGTVCEFNDANGAAAVTLQLNANATPASFAKVRSGFERNGVPVTDVGGVGEAAYSAQVKFAVTNNTLAALKGKVEVIITGPSSPEQLRLLMEAVLARV